MRPAALIYAALAVSVWWHPLPRLAQSFALAVTAVLFLALRSAWKRLDRVHAATLEAKDALREVREGNAAAQADILEKLESLTRFAQGEGRQP